MLTQRSHITALSKVGAALALCCAAATAGAMSDEEIRAETTRITAQYNAALAHCQTLQGNPQEICAEDAKGQQQVARAELDAKLQGDADHRYQVRAAMADADYRVAKERCNDMRGDAVQVCKKDAQAAHLKAQDDARVKRVEAPPASTTDGAMTPLTPAARDGNALHLPNR